MMQPEVLIESLKHSSQMTLLLPPGPVLMLKQPFVYACQELSATVYARNTDHRESSAAIDTTNVLETEELKSFWFPATRTRPMRRGEAAKEQ